MKIQKLLFGLTLFCVTLMTLANLTSLVILNAIYIPLLGIFHLPLLLIGLLSVIMTALVFFWAAKSSFTQAQATRVKDLERSIDLQRVLDLHSKQERTNLQASLDSHANAILARLETLRSIPSSSTVVSHSALEDQFYDRESHLDNLQALPLQHHSLKLR